MLHNRISFTGKILLLFLLVLNTVVLRKACAQYLGSSYPSEQSESNLLSQCMTENVETESIQKRSQKSHLDPDWPDGKWGVGTFYKYGSFSGRIASVFTNYQVFKPLYMDLRLGRAHYDVGLSLFCQIGEIKQATVAGKLHPGSFYGQSIEMYVSTGVSVYRNRIIDIVPTLAISYLEYKVYPMKRSFFDKKDTYSYIYDEIQESSSSIFGFGPGVFADFRLFKFLVDNDVSDISIRTRYNAFLFTKDKLYEKNGIMHEFSIGIIFSLGFKL
jgi:hypothetical protein